MFYQVFLSQQVKGCEKTTCRSCSSSLVSLEVFSAAQILLILQTTTRGLSIFLSSSFSIFFVLEFKKTGFFSVPPILFFSILFYFQICFPFISLFLLLCSVCFSLRFSYYSICYLSIIRHL